MTRERRASERAGVDAIVRLGTRARWGLALAGALALGACRQTVVLDSPPLDAGDPTGAGGGAAAGALGGAGVMGGDDAAAGAGTAGDKGGSGGNGRFDGGRPDASPFCIGGQIQYVPISMRSPDVIIAVDRSAPMQSWFGDGTRLQVIQMQVQALVTKYERSIHFGYEEFPSSMGMCSMGMGCCGGDVTPPAIRSAGGIASVINKMCDGNNGGCVQSQRPTADALAKCDKTLSFINDAGHNHYVILLTGGDPSCTSMDAGPACDSAVAETTKLMLESVGTAVFGVGDEATTSMCLDKLAAAGGLDSGGASPLFHLALTPTQLSAELAPVVETMAEEACHIDLHTSPLDPTRISLLFDNVEVPVDGVDGWSFDDGTSVKLTVHGSWCDTLLQNTSTVELVSGCLPPHK
jgi:hypothetical protein